MKKTVILDSGSYNNDHGPISFNKISNESKTALFLCKELENYLHKNGIKVYSSSFYRNTNFKNKLINAAALISIHCNESKNKDTQGFEISTIKEETKSNNLANSIFNVWKYNMDGTAHQNMIDGDVDKEAKYSVIYNAACSSCLIEITFISDLQNEQNVNKRLWIHKVAETIGIGILKWLQNLDN